MEQLVSKCTVSIYPRYDFFPTRRQSSRFSRTSGPFKLKSRWFSSGLSDYGRRFKKFVLVITEVSSSITINFAKEYLNFPAFNVSEIWNFVGYNLTVESKLWLLVSHPIHQNSGNLFTSIPLQGTDRNSSCEKPSKITFLHTNPDH